MKGGVGKSAWAELRCGFPKWAQGSTFGVPGIELSLISGRPEYPLLAVG